MGEKVAGFLLHFLTRNKAALHVTGIILFGYYWEVDPEGCALSHPAIHTYLTTALADCPTRCRKCKSAAFPHLPGPGEWLKDLGNGCLITLPSVPVVVLQVLDLCQDEEAGVAEVALEEYQSSLDDFFRKATGTMKNSRTILPVFFR